MQILCDDFSNPQQGTQPVSNTATEQPSVVSSDVATPGAGNVGEE